MTPGAGRAPAEERLNDPALVQKVESEVFRDEHIHHVKGNIDVQLRVRRDLHPRRGAGRGHPEELRPADAPAWTACARSRTCTHLPGEPAPAKDETRSGAHVGGH